MKGGAAVQELQQRGGAALHQAESNSPSSSACGRGKLGSSSISDSSSESVKLLSTTKDAASFAERNRAIVAFCAQ